MRAEPKAENLAQKVWLTKRELATYLGFSQRFIDQHVRPFLAVFKPNPGWGTKVLFNREEVDAFIRSRKQEGIEVPLS